jgi:site-specific recombinase XerD
MRNKRELELTRRPVKGTQPIADWRSKCTREWWWSGGDSNPRPLECDSSALPAEPFSTQIQGFCVAVNPRFEILDAIELYLDALHAKGLQAGTLLCYAYHLRSFLQCLARQGCHTLDAVRPTHIRRWLVERRASGLAEHTLHDCYETAQLFWRWCMREELTANNPFQRVEKPKVPPKVKPALTPDEVEQILQACEGKEWLRLRDKALCLLLLDTGLRIHEAHALTVEDASRNALFIRGKGGKQRVVFLSHEVRLALKRYLNACPYPLQEDSPLWWGEQGALTLHGLKLAIRRIGKRAGLNRPLGAHTFRRTFATWSLRNGIDLEHLRQLMGHSNYTVLRQYLALVEADLKQAHQQHSPLNNLRNRKR